MPEEHTRLLADRYELLAPLGRGTMGTVWRAWDRSLGREVAVKQIRQDPGLTPEQRAELRERMIREGRIAARFNHPSVATVHDAIVVGDSPWIIMELVEGRSLEQVIDEEGPLPPRLVAEIGCDLLSALRAAHAQGILHRDVKPSNVLLTDTGRVVLTDFGIAKGVGDTDLTKTGMVIGSPGYTAPERARGDHSGPESDLWSLGATLYFAVEGRPAFERGSVAATLAALMTESVDPPTQAGPLRPILDGLLEKDHTLRLSAENAATMLRAVADGRAPDLSATARAVHYGDRSAAPPAAGTARARGPFDTGPKLVGAAAAMGGGDRPPGERDDRPGGPGQGGPGQGGPGQGGPGQGGPGQGGPGQGGHRPPAPTAEYDGNQTVYVARPKAARYSPPPPGGAPPQAPPPGPTGQDRFGHQPDWPTPASAFGPAHPGEDRPGGAFGHRHPYGEPPGSEQAGRQATADPGRPAPHPGDRPTGHDGHRQDGPGPYPQAQRPQAQHPQPRQPQAQQQPQHPQAQHSHGRPGHGPGGQSPGGYGHVGHGPAGHGQGGHGPGGPGAPYPGPAQQPGDAGRNGSPAPPDFDPPGLGTEIFELSGLGGAEQKRPARVESRTGMFLLVGIALAGLAVIVILVASALSGSGDAKPASSPSPTTKGKVSDDAEDDDLSLPDPDPGSGSGDDSTTVASVEGTRLGGDPAGTPAGHGPRTHADPAGLFTIDVPAGMNGAAQGGRATFRSGDRSRHLTVRTLPRRRPEILDAARAAERRAAADAAYSDYRLLRLERLPSPPYPGTDVVDWEFTHTRDGRTVRVLSRWVTVPGGRSYVIRWSAPHDSWRQDAVARTTALDSFAPSRAAASGGS